MVLIANPYYEIREGKERNMSESTTGIPVIKMSRVTCVRTSEVDVGMVRIDRKPDLSTGTATHVSRVVSPTRAMFMVDLFEGIARRPSFRVEVIVITMGGPDLRTRLGIRVERGIFSATTGDLITW